MAETETPDGSKIVIEIEEEIEGDLIGTRNYRFSRIGESVPIKSDAGFIFDMDSLPRCPLAVSERFGLIFVAHPSGFCVARTKDVMDTAKELKNGGNGSCIQKLSVADVPLGKVSILALSADSSMLAASVEHNLYFFTVAGLLNKDHEPSFSKSLTVSSCIKDMQWSTHLEDQYVVLTSDGNLYRGAGQNALSNSMDNVDAVSWSMHGKFLAVAKNEYVIILSSKFKEKLRIKLSIDSLVGDSDADCFVKVDSVRWVRPDCIIVGCFRQSADGKEDNYLVQFITVKDGKIRNPSSNPVALTFCDAFLTINDDYIPYGNGPYMLVSYLDECEIAFATHRKVTDQHIVLFGWSSDEKNEAKMIEISNDAWVPTIGLQDNSDDNLILGLAVNKIYQDDKIRFVLGEEDTEVSPCSVLLCLTLDGKLFMFHFASATGPSLLPRDVISVSDEEEESPPLSSQQRVMNTCNDEKQIGDQAYLELQPQKVKGNEPSGETGYEAHMRSGDEQTKSTAFSKLSVGGTEQDVPVARLNDNRDERRSLSLQKQDSDFEAALFKTSEPVNSEAVKDLNRFENQEVAGVKSSADSVPAHDKPDNKPFGASLEDRRASREFSVSKTSTGLHGSSGSFSSGSAFSSNNFGVQSFSLPHAGVQGSAQQDVPVARLNDSRDEGRSLPSQKQDGDFQAALFKTSEPVNSEAVKDLNRLENQEVAGVKSSADSVSAHDKSDNKAFGASLEDRMASRDLSVSKTSTGLLGSSGSFSSGSALSLHNFGPQSFSLPHAGVQGSAQQDVPVARLNDSRDKGQSLPSQKQVGDFEVPLFKAPEPVNPGAVKDLKRFENQEVAGAKSSSDSVSISANDKSDNTLFGASLADRRASIELSNKASTGLHGSSGSFSSGSVLSPNIFGVQSFSSPHAGIQGSAELSGKSGSTNLHVSSGSFSSGGIFSSRTFDVKSPLSPHAAVQGNRPDTSAGITQFSSGSQKLLFPKMISGPSTSSNLLGQEASAGAGVTYSLPVVSNVQQSLGKSSAFEFSDKGNQRSHTPSRHLSSEPNLSEQRSVEEMAKELDALLNSIEGPGGFYDASVAAHKPSVTALEEGIWVLSDKCRKWINTMDRGIGEVQLLLDKTVQVLARKIYMEAIVKQATDSQYLDIWNRQKLNSELDMKRRHILEINQNLTNQLIELERHLNTLELQRFGDRSDVQMNRRSFHTKHGPPRHVQSLHSLHNTMNAQLAAAEKLSECLSKQMAVLSIETEPVKNQNVKKELFDTIGISYDGTTFSSPGQEKAREISLKSKVLLPSCSTAANTDLKKSQQGAVKSSEPETARRRRDSLDRSWASIEPPKTTVKRMLLQEDRQMSPGRLALSTGVLKLNHRLSQGSVVSHDTPRGALNLPQSKGNQDVQIKRLSEGQSNSSLWDGYRSDSSKTPVTSALSLGSGFQTKPIVSQDAVRNLTLTLKSDPVMVNDPKFSQQSQSFPEASSNLQGSLAKNIFQKKSIEFSDSTSKDTVKSKFAVGSGNQRPIVAESSSIWSRKSQDSPFTAVSSAGSGTAFSGKSFSLEASTRESQLGVAVSSSIASLPVPVTSAPTSFLFKDATSSTTSTISLGKSPTGFGINLGATQTVPVSGSSASFPSFPSTPSFGATREPMTSSSFKPSANIELNTSKSDLSKLNPDTSESSTHVVPVPKFDLKPDEIPSAQTSPPQPEHSSGAPKMKLGFSVPSEPTSEPSTTSFSGGQLNLSATNSSVLASNSKAEQPVVSPALSSSPAISNPVEEVGKENENSDVALTQEDEMDEEAPDTTQLTLGNLGGFGLGSAPNPGAPKQNPFGAPITSFTAAPSTGGLFRPASFDIASSQPSQPSQQTNFGGFSSGFGSNNNQSNAGQGFGQPARIGAGQQALGSVLGSFGQSRQLGAGLPGTVASPNPFGSGFGGNQTAGGFATAASGGGFANLASGGGGFGGLATGGGGFAAAPTGGGGFAAATTGSGGFGGAASAGGGFAGASSGGFGAFGGQGGSGFSAFGSSGGTGRPPSELFTQMRK